MSKKTTANPDATQNSFNKEKDPSDPTANYKCLRNAADGSMYYGEIAFVRKSNGQLIKNASPAFESDIKPLEAEQRLEQFEMVRHGHGLQMFSGQRNDDGVVTKYEGGWLRNRKHGQGSAVYTDGSTYKGKFVRDVKDGKGVYAWAQGHEYKGTFRDDQMDGEGEFTHANGSELKGQFKRNLYQKDNFFLNPLDDQRLHEKVIERLTSIRQVEAAEALKRQQQIEAAEALGDGSTGQDGQGTGMDESEPMQYSQAEGGNNGGFATNGMDEFEQMGMDDMEGYDQNQAF